MSRQRRWAKYALDTIHKVKGSESQAKFRTHALRLPTLIKQAGLAQALAFIESRDDEGKQLVEAVGAALGRTGIVKLAIAAELSEYMALSRDVVAAAVWFRRFAQSELAGESKT